MVRSSYRPTNKRFRDRFQEFAETKTKRKDISIRMRIQRKNGNIEEDR